MRDYIKKYKNEFGEIICNCCGNHTVSEDQEIAEQNLCDDCYDEINGDEIIGYRKGE